MFHGKPNTRWRALRPKKKSPCTDVSPLDLHLLSTCVFIYTPSESFLYEVTLWSVVFSESRSGFVNAPGIFAHAASAMTESHYDFSAYAAHRCNSVTILFCFHCWHCRLSWWMMCRSVQRFLLFGFVYCVYFTLSRLPFFFWTQRTGVPPQYILESCSFIHNCK